MTRPEVRAGPTILKLIAPTVEASKSGVDVLVELFFCAVETNANMLVQIANKRILFMG